MFAFIAVNVTIPLVSLTNEELNYVYYLENQGKTQTHEEYFRLSSVGTFIEDFPQFALQLAYSKVSSHKYSRAGGVSDAMFYPWVSLYGS